MPKYTDTELIDFLEGLNKQNTYTGKCVLRISDLGRGWRLHETSRKYAKPTIREAIESFIDLEIGGNENNG